MFTVFYADLDKADTVEAWLVLDAEPSAEPGLPNDRSNRL